MLLRVVLQRRPEKLVRHRLSRPVQELLRVGAVPNHHLLDVHLAPVDVQAALRSYWGLRATLWLEKAILADLDGADVITGVGDRGCFGGKFDATPDNVLPLAEQCGWSLDGCISRRPNGNLGPS